MIARFAWMKRFLFLFAVSALAFSNTTTLSSTGVALAAAPSAAGCLHTAAQIGAGAPKQAALQALAPSACPSGLLALWKLDETSGTTFVDSANGHDGTCTTGCPVSTTGRVGTALTFGPTTAVTITVPAVSPFDFALSDSFTLEAWMKPSTSCSGDQPVIGRTSAGGATFQWYLSCDTGKAQLYVRDVNNNVAYIHSTSTISNSASFHHVVGVQDAGANELRLYVDGTLEATTPTTYTAGFGSNTPLYLGWFKTGVIRHFSGDLDEVAVYNRVLTAQEISDHHTQGLDGRGICDLVGVVLDHFLYLPLVTK